MDDHVYLAILYHMKVCFVRGSHWHRILREVMHQFDQNDPLAVAYMHAQKKKLKPALGAD